MSRCALDLSLSLSLGRLFIARRFFLCAATTRLGGGLLWVHSFFLRRCVFSNVFCGQTQARFLVHHNFRDHMEREGSLFERIIFVVASRQSALLQTKETFNKNEGFFVSLRSFSRSLFDKARRRRRRRHRFETTPLCVVKAKKKALTKTLDVPLLLLRTTTYYDSSIYIG